MLPNEKTSQQPKSGSPAQTERGVVKLFAKYPAHNNYFCSYEVFVEAEIFKPDSARSAMVYFVSENTLEKSYYSNGRFFFFLPKSVQPMFEEVLDSKNLMLSVLIVMDANRPSKDQSEVTFRIQQRDLVKAI